MIVHGTVTKRQFGFIRRQLLISFNTRDEFAHKRRNRGGKLPTFHWRIAENRRVDWPATRTFSPFRRLFSQFFYARNAALTFVLNCQLALHYCCFVMGFFARMRLCTFSEIEAIFSQVDRRARLENRNWEFCEGYVAWCAPGALSVLLSVVILCNHKKIFILIIAIFYIAMSLIQSRFYLYSCVFNYDIIWIVQNLMAKCKSINLMK